MAVSNIDTFNDLTGRILADLYLQFPLPHYLPAGKYVEPAETYSEKLGMDMPSKEAEFFIATAEWLIRAGYLSGSVVPYSSVQDAVLTAKGLEVLNATPDSLNTGPSLGTRLADAAKEGGKETMRGLVTEALGIGARFVSPLIGLSS